MRGDIWPLPEGDGIVNMFDFAVFADNWLIGAPWPPEKVTNPNPSHDQNDVSIATDVSWTADANATSYDVYFGTSFGSVDQASDPCVLPGRGNQSAITYDPGILNYETDYWWRIDARNSVATIRGDVWKFTTQLEPELSESIIGWWEFEGDANDSSGYGNDGTLEGDATTISDPDRGLVLSLDGSGDYVDVGDADSLDFGIADSFTIVARINTNQSQCLIVNKRYCTSGGTWQEGYSLSLYQSKLYFGIEDISNNSLSIHGSTIVGDGQWHHIAAVRDATTDKLHLYLNGNSDVTPVTDITTASLNTAQPFTIGSFNRSSGDQLYFNGSIDDVRIYNKALSAQEIQQLYQAGL